VSVSGREHEQVASLLLPYAASTSTNICIKRIWFILCSKCKIFGSRLEKYLRCVQLPTGVGFGLTRKERTEPLSSLLFGDNATATLTEARSVAPRHEPATVQPSGVVVGRRRCRP
jgi:hypothetical protein